MRSINAILKHLADYLACSDTQQKLCQRQDSRVIIISIIYYKMLLKKIKQKTSNMCDVYQYCLVQSYAMHSPNQKFNFQG